MNKKIVPIQYPPNLDEMLDNWVSCAEENVSLALALRRPDPQ